MIYNAGTGARARTWSTAQGPGTGFSGDGATQGVQPPPRSSSSPAPPTPSWEWKEGRLLAYELILKFLLTNHTHYLFPTALVEKARAASSDHYRIQGSSHVPRRLKVPQSQHAMVTPGKGCELLWLPWLMWW